MSVFLFVLGWACIVNLPRLLLAILFFNAREPTFLTYSLGFLSVIFFMKYDSGLKDVVAAFKEHLIAVLKEFARTMRAWFDMFHLMVTGRSFIVVEVIEVEKIVYQDRVRMVNQRIEVPVFRDMTRADACEIIGCAPDADKITIDRKYRSILQKVHPDHGGSVFLTTIVNQARDQLRTRRC